VWLYFRFPLGLRMVEELLAAHGIIVSHETVRQWARKFGQERLTRFLDWVDRFFGDAGMADRMLFPPLSG
jgi:transposase-like protein